MSADILLPAPLHVPKKRTHGLLYYDQVYSKGPGRHSDGGNLYLVVDPSGARRWTFMYERSGRQREMGIGPVHLVTIEDARAKANEARQQLRAGVDPLDKKVADKKAAASRKTFEEIRDEVIVLRCSTWKMPAQGQTRPTD